jgi:hypothetical protein
MECRYFYLQISNLDSLFPPERRIAVILSTQKHTSDAPVLFMSSTILYKSNNFKESVYVNFPVLILKFHRSDANAYQLKLFFDFFNPVDDTSCGAGHKCIFQESVLQLGPIPLTSCQPDSSGVKEFRLNLSNSSQILYSDGKLLSSFPPSLLSMKIYSSPQLQLDCLGSSLLHSEAGQVFSHSHIPSIAARSRPTTPPPCLQGCLCETPYYTGSPQLTQRDSVATHTHSVTRNTTQAQLHSIMTAGTQNMTFRDQSSSIDASKNQSLSQTSKQREYCDSTASLVYSQHRDSSNTAYSSHHDALSPAPSGYSVRNSVHNCAIPLPELQSIGSINLSHGATRNSTRIHQANSIANSTSTLTDPTQSYYQPSHLSPKSYFAQGWNSISNCSSIHSGSISRLYPRHHQHLDIVLTNQQLEESSRASRASSPAPQHNVQHKEVHFLPSQNVPMSGYMQLPSRDGPS